VSEEVEASIVSTAPPPEISPPGGARARGGLGFEPGLGFRFGEHARPWGGGAGAVGALARDSFASAPTGRRRRRISTSVPPTQGYRVGDGRGYPPPPPPHFLRESGSVRDSRFRSPEGSDSGPPHARSSNRTGKDWKKTSSGYWCVAAEGMSLAWRPGAPASPIAEKAFARGAGTPSARRPSRAPGAYRRRFGRWSREPAEHS